MEKPRQNTAPSAATLSRPTRCHGLPNWRSRTKAVKVNFSCGFLSGTSKSSAMGGPNLEIFKVSLASSFLLGTPIH